MREALSDRMTLWNGWLPGQVPNDPVIAEELEENAIDLEGNELRVRERPSFAIGIESIKRSFVDR